MAKFEFTLWLAYWYLQTDGFTFEWDLGNQTKSKIKHGVSPEEVETVFQQKLAVPLGRQVSPSTSEERLCLVGPSSEGRMINVVFTLRSGKVRPISSRPTNKKERTMYEKINKALKNL